MLNKIFKSRELFNLEDFLFGNPLGVQPIHLYVLAGLVGLTFVLLALLYNYLLLDNFNTSLALSRRVPSSVRLCLHYSAGGDRQPGPALSASCSSMPC